jgi:hypothetical protein
MSKIVVKQSTTDDSYTFGISLFEEQIVRALLLSDNFSLLKQLTSQFRVVIFTNNKIGNFLDARVNELKINRVDIVKLNDIKESLAVRVFSFCLTWSDPSLATMKILQRERLDKRVSVFGFLFRKVFFIYFRNSVVLKKMFRQLLLLSFNLDRVKDSSVVPLPKLDVFLATALTNAESDLPLSIYFRKQSIPVIATLRSWDNLVTKGTLRFQPNILLSHSSYMTDLAIRVHGIIPSSIVQSVTPAYQKQFLPKNHSAHGVKLKFTYGCIGPMLNPDEVNFISWLAEISTEIDSTITILQHPKFAHDLSDINSGKLLFKTFDYLSSTLQDYYEFIAEQNFVIASGTSVALDALLVGTPLIGLAFEIIEQEYWLSHLRLYDTSPHSKFLFEKMSIKKVYSKLELIELLKGNCIWQNSLNNEGTLQMLTGDTNIKFSEQIFSLIKQGSF